MSLEYVKIKISDKKNKKVSVEVATECDMPIEARYIDFCDLEKQVKNIKKQLYKNKKNEVKVMDKIVTVQLSDNQVSKIQTTIKDYMIHQNRFIPAYQEIFDILGQARKKTYTNFDKIKDEMTIDTVYDEENESLYDAFYDLANKNKDVLVKYNSLIEYLKSEVKQNEPKETT